MIFYKKLANDLQLYSFALNLYDACVANKMVEGKQMTVSLHVDDLNVSHDHPKEIDNFLNRVQATYG